MMVILQKKFHRLAYTKSPKLQMRECMRVRNVFITKVVSIEGKSQILRSPDDLIYSV